MDAHESKPHAAGSGSWSSSLIEREPKDAQYEQHEQQPQAVAGTSSQVARSIQLISKGSPAWQETESIACHILAASVSLPGPRAVAPIPVAKARRHRERSVTRRLSPAAGATLGSALGRRFAPALEIRSFCDCIRSLAEYREPASED
ncbi:hypothetical protein TgHK011_007559 [Trichoderma gracile]|nr:hypothetical protein TgHK011_007559 [Trichoderma gracile]